jgi:glutathione S-transferase
MHYLGKTMKLLGTQTSPYVRKARLVLLEKAIAHDYVIDPPNDPNTQVTRANPLGRIPALILDDGSCVFDSTVIVDFADQLNDQPILIPRNDLQARMRVKRWEALADGVMDSAIVLRNEKLRRVEHQDAAILTLHTDAIVRALAHIAAQLGPQIWCEGDTLTLADLALVSALIYLDLRVAEINWRGDHPNLARWFERMSARASVITALAD